MNLSELTQRLRTSYLGNLSATQVPDEKLHEAIVEAYEHLLDRFPHTAAKTWYKFTTTSGQGTYSIPGHVGALRQVWDISRWRPLTQLPDTAIASLDGRAGAISTSFVRVGETILLYPTPSDAREIGVQAKVTAATLDSATDEPLLDQTWHHGILRRARYEWYDHYQPDISKARAALLSWNEWISTKPAQIQEEVSNISNGVQAPVLAAAQLDMFRSPRRINDNLWAWRDY